MKNNLLKKQKMISMKELKDQIAEEKEEEEMKKEVMNKSKKKKKSRD